MFSCFNNVEKYVDAGYSILLNGEAGVGKTAFTKQLFDKKFPKKWKYFSSSTLDVFLDFIGLPRDVEDKDGHHIIEYVKPRWHFDNIEAIFLDEFSRSPKKMRNAVMELLQFQEINGEPFGNLKCIIAAINPHENSEYSDVEPLDKAQLDRFQVHINVPFLLDTDYFINKYNKDIAGAAIEWWAELEKDIQKKVSPRRLEYAIETFLIKGDLNDILPKETNIKKLLDNLKLGSVGSRVEKLFKVKNKDIIKKELKDINVISYIKKHLDENSFIEKFTKYLPNEIVTQEASTNNELCDYIKNNLGDFDPALIAPLQQMGCFRESDFRTAFIYLDKNFPDATYSSRKSYKMKMILNALPEISSIKVSQNDVPKLQKLIQLTNCFLEKAHYKTISKLNTDSKFIEKFANLSELNTVQNLGLDFDTSWKLKHHIDSIIAEKKYQERIKQQAELDKANKIVANPLLSDQNYTYATPNSVINPNTWTNSQQTVMTPQGPMTTKG